MPYDREQEKDFFRQVCGQLQHIHDAKSATYRDSWKKRGELVSVFGNVARKFDRINNIASDPETWMKAISGDTNEMVEETILDMSVYCILWCVFMMENRPGNFHRALEKALGKEISNG